MEDRTTFNHSAHIELWTWMSENPGATKYDWPGWFDNGGKYERVILSCFACAGCEECSTCPIDWKAISKEPECSNQKHTGIYDIWEHNPSFEERTRLALLIANAPLKNGMCLEGERSEQR